MGYALKGSPKIVNGKRFVLVYDFEALCEIETDHPQIMSGVMDMTKVQSPIYMRGLIFRGLRDQVTEESAVSGILNGVGYPGALQWFLDAVKIAFSDDGGETVNPTLAQSQN